MTPTDPTTASTIVAVARAQLESRCATLSDHLETELALIAMDEMLPAAIRFEAELILEEARGIA